MKNIITFIIISLIPFSVLADNCLVSTDTRLLMNSSPSLQSEKLLKKDGQYSAILKNGDIVLAKFSTCSLGMTAHYFSIKELSNDELLQRVKMFLTRALPSETVVKKVLPQLDGLSANKFNKTILLEGFGSQHQIIVKPSKSQIFKQHIQYDWIPPEF